MQSKWDERYSEAGFAYGTEPNDFLASHRQRLAQGGKVLCLAEGEGRNAVFLARHGFDVVAVDASQVGMAKAERHAAAHGVTITTVVADLAEFPIGSQEYDGVISIFCHLPPPVRTILHRRIIDGLKPGGVLILEGYTPAQIGRTTGGPPHKELTFNLATLQEEFAALEQLHAVELEREVHEGRLHTGIGAVVQFIAVKT